MTLGHQIVLLFVLPIPIASIVWTLTHEEVFREPRDWCTAKSKSCRRLFSRKFFYLFTCEYCLSHYVAVFFLFITRYTLLFDDWRGYLIAGFSLVWLANVYMSFLAGCAWRFEKMGWKSPRQSRETAPRSGVRRATTEICIALRLDEGSHAAMAMIESVVIVSCRLARLWMKGISFVRIT
jgi:hypothetical protein